MPAIKKRLDELAADAAERHLRCGAVGDWVSRRPQSADWADQYDHWAWVIAEGAAAAAKQGDYRRARKLAELNDVYLPPGAEYALDNDIPLEECPAWVAFREACELAEGIDCFLAAVGRGAQEAALAADCRACLDMLLVLADWCDDRGRPAAAAAARHLHALASTLP